MGQENQIQDVILNDLATKIFNEYLYLQVDTSTLMPGITAVELTNGGTQIGVDANSFNKTRDTATLQTKLENNKGVVQFTLATGEPYTQPVNIGSFGMMNQVTSGGGLGIVAALPVSFTKDINLQSKIRAEFQTIRIGDV